MSLLEPKANSPDRVMNTLVILLLSPVPDQSSLFSIPTVAAICFLKVDLASREKNTIQMRNKFYDLSVLHPSINRHNSRASHVDELRIGCHDLVEASLGVGLG